MKPRRIILPLLLLGLTLFSPGRTAHAQSQKTDWIYVSVDKQVDVNAWQFSFHHDGSDLRAVGNILLRIDPVQYPYVQFNPNDGGVAGLANSQYIWTNNSDTGNVNTWWCNPFTQIQHTLSDSFFVFGLQANPNLPYAQIEDSTIMIEWIASFESNSCANTSTISSGTFEVVPTIWQSYPELDTVTGVASVLADCDPSFDFTVQNRNSLKFSIDHMVFQLMNSFTGTMRPSEAIPPPGWILDSVTQLAAYFETSTASVPYGSSLGGFKVGLRTPATPLAVPFVWSAFQGSGIMERDTTPAISVTPCSGSSNSTQDTLTASNNRGCESHFRLYNSHSGEGNLTVSRITSLRLQITTPGVTWSAATNPPGPCWSWTGVGTQTLYFLTGNESCGLPGGDTAIYGGTIDGATPGQPVTVHWSDSSSGVAVSSGDVTVECTNTTSDSVFVDAISNCMYDVRVKNIHLPASNLHAVTLIMPPGAGTFVPGSFSSNTNWTPSGSGGSVQFTAGAGNGLKPGATDTFTFAINPAKEGNPWSLTVLTKEAQTDKQITDTIINNIPGCTPPPVLDSVIHHVGHANCADTIQIVNHGTSPIDTIKVIAAAGVSIASAKIAAPWSQPVVAGNTVTLFGYQIQPSVPLYFIVSYSGEANTPFNVQVETHHTNGTMPMDNASVICAGSGVLSPQAEQAPITLTIAPNPLHDQTNIALTTVASGNVQIVLLNVLGQSVRVVESGMLTAGEHSYTLEASSLPAGTYYLRLETNGQVITKKLAIER